MYRANSVTLSGVPGVHAFHSPITTGIIHDAHFPLVGYAWERNKKQRGGPLGLSLRARLPIEAR